MRFVIVTLLLFTGTFAYSQAPDSTILSSSRFLKQLKSGDSLIYYQCHVEEAIQQLSTVSGQTLTGKQQKYSITEKYVVKRAGSNYSVDYYSSSLTVFPNRKFSGLKVRENKYWEFKKESSFQLDNKVARILVALERKGREATEYDFAITKYTTNQLIISSRKEFKQLVIDGSYVISKLIAK